MKGIFQIIKYEGDNSTFVWKHPTEDFNIGSQLIVHESQEALFFMNGQALDLFGPGRHTLETQNIPLVGKYFNRQTNNETPFHCEIYFINKTEQMAIKWGTDSKVQYMEPTYKFPLQIGARGEMSVRVEDSRKLLVKIVGTLTKTLKMENTVSIRQTDNEKEIFKKQHVGLEASVSQSELVAMFRAFLMARVKPCLARTMQNSEFGIFEVDSRMGDLSEVLHGQLMPDFSDYGLSLERFFVTEIAKPVEGADDSYGAYVKFRDIHVRQYSDVAEAQLEQRVEIIRQQTMAQKMVIESQGIATKRAQEGYTYQHERGFDVAEKVAQNEAVAGMTNTGIGLGMMTGMAGGMGPMVAGITTNALGAAQGGASSPVVAGIGIPPVNPTPQPAASVATPAPVPTDDMAVFKQKLEKLKMMKDMGMLSDAEFEAQRQTLLCSL